VADGKWPSRAVFLEAWVRELFSAAAGSAFLAARTGRAAGARDMANSATSGDPSAGASLSAGRPAIAYRVSHRFRTGRPA